MALEKESLDPVDTIYDPFGDTIGGSSDYGGILEGGGQGSGNVDEGTSYVNLEEPPVVPPESKNSYLPIILGFLAIKYLGVI